MEKIIILIIAVILAGMVRDIFLQKRNRSIDEKSFVIEYTIFAKIFMGIIIACILLFIFVDFLSSDNFLQNWSKYILVEGMIILVFAICSYSCSKIYVEFGISQIIIQPIIRGKRIYSYEEIKDYKISKFNELILYFDDGFKYEVPTTSGSTVANIVIPQHMRKSNNNVERSFVI